MPDRNKTQSDKTKTTHSHGVDSNDERSSQNRKSGDQGKAGQDTDGDGKVVKPGQKPGQSGGRGLPHNK